MNIRHWLFDKGPMLNSSVGCGPNTDIRHQSFWQGVNVKFKCWLWAQYWYKTLVFFLFFFFFPIHLVRSWMTRKISYHGPILASKAQCRVYSNLWKLLPRLLTTKNYLLWGRLPLWPVPTLAFSGHTFKMTSRCKLIILRDFHASLVWTKAYFLILALKQRRRH